MSMSPTRPLRIIALLALLAIGSSARADFVLKVYEDVADPFTTMTAPVATFTFDLSNGYSSSDGFSQNSMKISFSNADFSVNGGIDSDSLGPSDPTGLHFTGTIINASASSHKISIIASDNGFSYPTGPGYALSSSTDGTLTNTGSGDGYDYTGSVIYGSNPHLFDRTFGNAPIAFADSGTAPHTTTFSGNSGPDAFTTNSWVGVTIALNTTLGGKVGNLDRTIEINTSSLVKSRAVPEPGSLALLGLGVLGAGAWVARRRNL